MHTLATAVIQCVGQLNIFCSVRSIFSCYTLTRWHNSKNNTNKQQRKKGTHILN